MRWFVHELGATVLAVSTVLSAFMGGLALGGFAAGRVVHRVRNPLLAYGIAEIVLAALAACVPALLGSAQSLYAALYPKLADSFWALSGVRFAVGVLVLLPPTFLLGATLPLLASHVGPSTGRRRVAHLYAANTLGAVCGTVAASFALLPAFGLSGTLRLAMGVNLGVGLVAVLLSRAARPVPDEDGAAVHAPGPDVPRPALLATAGVLGFAALALEVLWTRTLSLALGATVYAFAVVLSTFLAGIAGGSALAARILRRPASAARLFVLAPAAVGLLALAAVPLFDRLPALFLRLAARAGGTWLDGLAVNFAIAALPMLLPTLVSGAALPLAIGIDRATRGTGRTVGDLYAANTLGAILGSWGAGFVLIRLLGLRGGIVCVSLLLAATSVLLLVRRGAPRFALGIAAAAAAGALLLPEWNPAALTRGGFAVASEMRRLAVDELSPDRAELVFFEEGVTTTVSVRRSGHELTMQMNGVTEASNTGDYATQVFLGALPVILHPAPRDILVIGLGSGITAAAAGGHPGVETLECVEISESVVRGAAWFEESNRGLLHDPRARIVVGDGRNHLALSGRTFDAVISHPSNVWVSGASSLLTAEFFAACREGLSPGGLFASWLQGYSLSPEALRGVLAAARLHFARVTLWSAGWGDLVILAGDETLSIDAQRVLAKAAQHEDIRRLLRESGTPDLVTFASRCLLAGEALDRYVGGAAANTDDNLLLEFQAPKLLYRDTLPELYTGLHAAAGGVEQLVAAAPEGLLAQLPAARRVRELESQARLAFRAGEGEAGLAAAEEAWRLRSGDPAVADVLSQALNGRGEARARHGGVAEALALYRRAAEVDPEYGDPPANVARLYLEAGDLEAAEVAISEALRREPRRAEFHALRARVRTRARDLEPAHEDALESLRLDPSCHDGFLALGDVLVKLSEHDRADSIFAAGRARHPDSQILRQAAEDLARVRRKVASTP
ncbi:MAG: fused MFS/spermidine synthase [Candidatus Eiseniibacteriota bacterium]